MMHTLKNNKLQITINKIGAELCKITSTKFGTEFMWDGNPEVWSGISPVLFPIIGALKNGSYLFDNKIFELPKHGFVRHNDHLELNKEAENHLNFVLRHNDHLLKSYPFKFEFNLGYTLTDNTVEVTHAIRNCDDHTMYFSVGGHPAFKCPVFKDEHYEDYILEFEYNENSNTHLINMDNGLITNRTQPILVNSNSIKLRHDLFNQDALILKDLKSKKVTLKSNTHGAILTVSYPDFPYLGIWAKPSGDYVCIEPWLGIADNEITNQNLKTKEGILALDPKNEFKASYTIEIHDDHLV
ncbi:aldose 1-epimerase family protein [Aestuariivivens sediminis]|uniref:aldose 1-epimerase family protein n=1 Tax=Aestuariivivens sediminis TaxID=2913557 RepID=UPI0030B8311B